MKQHTMEGGKRPERIQAEEAGRILGVSATTVKRMALTGELPGFKVRGVWTFDEQRVRKWVTDKECGSPCQSKPSSKKTPPTSFNGAVKALGTSDFKAKTEMYAALYEQAISKKPVAA